MSRKIIVTESQLKRLLDRMINESTMDVEEKLDYERFSGGDELQQLRDTIDNNILVSVAFVKKDGSVRHMSIKKSLSSYVGSDREKTEKQMNIEMNNNIKKVVDMKISWSKHLMIGMQTTTNSGTFSYITLKYGDEMIPSLTKDYSPVPVVDYVPKKDSTKFGPKDQ